MALHRMHTTRHLSELEEIIDEFVDRLGQEPNAQETSSLKEQIAQAVWDEERLASQRRLASSRMTPESPEEVTDLHGQGGGGVLVLLVVCLAWLCSLFTGSAKKGLPLMQGPVSNFLDSDGKPLLPDSDSNPLNPLRARETWRHDSGIDRRSSRRQMWSMSSRRRTWLVLPDPTKGLTFSRPQQQSPQPPRGAENRET